MNSLPEPLLKSSEIPDKNPVICFRPESYWFRVQDNLEALLELTEAELKAYLVVTRQIQRDPRGGEVSVRDLAARLRLGSVGYACQILDSLCRKGLLTAEKRPGRTTRYGNPIRWKSRADAPFPAAQRCSTRVERRCSTGVEHPSLLNRERKTENTASVVSTDQAPRPEAPARPVTADETQIVREALQDATGITSDPQDPLPGEVAVVGQQLGAEPAVVARWIAETAVRKRRRGDPVESNGFFRHVIRRDLPGWMRRNPGAVTALARRSVVPIDITGPDPETESPRPCRCGGTGRINYGGRSRLCGCQL